MQTIRLSITNISFTSGKQYLFDAYITIIKCSFCTFSKIIRNFASVIILLTLVRHYQVIELYTNIMKTTIKEQDGNLVAILEGRLDTAAAPQTEKDLKAIYDCSGQDIILDCTELTYISSSGLRLFLGVQKTAKLKGSHVYIKGINNEIRNVFAMTGFINLFEFK